MIIRCRRCDCNYKVPDSLVGAHAPCPECGAPNKVASMEVIDVAYEVQGDLPPEPEPTEAPGQPDENTRDAVFAGAVFTDDLPADEEPPWDTQRSYTVYINRQMEKNGLPCCSLACLTFVLLFFLLIRGCMSLF